jgi:hypothetical protein
VHIRSSWSALHNLFRTSLGFLKDHRSPHLREEPTGKVIQLCRFPAQKTDKTTEFKEKMCSSVDDYIGLESELALRRVRETL